MCAGSDGRDTYSIGSTENNLILMTVPPPLPRHPPTLITKDPVQLFFALEEDRTAALQNSAVLSRGKESRNLLQLSVRWKGLCCSDNDKQQKLIEVFYSTDNINP